MNENVTIDDVKGLTMSQIRDCINQEKYNKQNSNCENEQQNEQQKHNEENGNQHRHRHGMN